MICICVMCTNIYIHVYMYLYICIHILMYTYSQHVEFRGMFLKSLENIIKATLSVVVKFRSFTSFTFPMGRGALE